jgi:cytochrome c biogenesis protein CcmG, thiol:disulfide interchange protein DsbE
MATSRADTDSNGSLVTALIVVGVVAGIAFVPRIFGGGALSVGQAPLVGKPAPAFSLQVVANGEEGQSSVSLADLKGSPVLLDFWATWCGPCQAEAPIVNSVANRYKDRGLKVVGIDTEEGPGKGGPWARAHHIGYPIVYDQGYATEAHYGIEAMPTLIIISKTGEVAAVRTGVTDGDELDALVHKVL